MKVTATRLRGFEHRIDIRNHELAADEPADLGGDDAGPRPQELLAASLASCSAITMEMYADRKGWHVGDLAVEVSYEPSSDRPQTRFEIVVRMSDAVPEDQRNRLIEIARRCPVHRTLAGEVTFDERVEVA